MEGLCPNCMRPVPGGRFCPHCGYDFLQGMPGHGDSIHTAPVNPQQFYTAPVSRPEPVQPPVQPVSQPVTKPRRVRKLPILLGAVLLLTAVLLFPKEEERYDLPEPVEMPEFTMPPAVKQYLFSYQADDLTVTVDQNREVSITVSNLPLREQYTVNLPKSSNNTIEFYWSVFAYSPTRTLKCMTYHPKRDYEEQNQVIRLSEMQTILFMNKEESDTFYNVQGVPLKMTHTANSITWKCTLPENFPAVPDEPFPVDPAAFTGFKVEVYDHDDPAKIIRKYTVE